MSFNSLLTVDFLLLLPFVRGSIIGAAAYSTPPSARGMRRGGEKVIKKWKSTLLPPLSRSKRNASIIHDTLHPPRRQLLKSHWLPAPAVCYISRHKALSTRQGRGQEWLALLVIDRNGFGRNRKSQILKWQFRPKAETNRKRCISAERGSFCRNCLISGKNSHVSAFFKQGNWSKWSNFCRNKALPAEMPLSVSFCFRQKHFCIILRSNFRPKAETAPLSVDH